ncbi:hypothetical protein NECHADRAFT_52490 [Paecilomyces variotii No. 5]|uniref:NAD-dependent epimerase/dehydratase domain-containing protein n=1 Tax=Byssochlamys spectabilis (strain No. 5 / NBRC 109023) TaxID=1356009 RepID=V5FW41_BYSSN|nr:hypothetical protein NECHADRAFT_52490 [Paecilomyces variotii No. 5]
MAGDLVLLTGASGFVGIRVLAIALAHGYRVRCAVRTVAAAEKIHAAKSIKDLAPTQEQLSMVLVPDIIVPHAHDEAVKGVQYIIHCASPMHPENSTGTEDEVFIQPAVQGSVGMLTSALAYARSTLKRVVITSSIVAIIPPEYFMGHGDPTKLPFNADSRVPNLSPPYAPPGFGVYQASKTAALNAIESWRTTNSAPFDIITPMPGLITGRDDLATTPEGLAKGGNAILLSLLKGNKSPIPLNSAFVDVDDVASAHVRALDPDVPGNQGFVLGKPAHFDKATSVVKSRFPEAYTDRLFQEGGEQPTIEVPLDTSKTETVLGIKPTPFQDTVITVAGQYIRLVKGQQ